MTLMCLGFTINNHYSFGRWYLSIQWKVYWVGWFSHQRKPVKVEIKPFSPSRPVLPSYPLLAASLRLNLPLPYWSQFDPVLVASPSLIPPSHSPCLPLSLWSLHATWPGRHSKLDSHSFVGVHKKWQLELARRQLWDAKTSVSWSQYQVIVSVSLAEDNQTLSPKWQDAKGVL